LDFGCDANQRDGSALEMAECGTLPADRGSEQPVARFFKSCSQSRGLALASRMEKQMKRWQMMVALAGALALPAFADEPRHVIIMVADGSGFNTWLATSMYQGHYDAATGQMKQVFTGPEWMGLACSTYPLTTANKPTRKAVQDPKVVYDAAKAWNKEKEQLQEFTAYTWLKKTYTDSAASATALATGNKTYNAAINWSDKDAPLLSIAEIAKAKGLSAGAITTVPISHATPAALGGAHSSARDAYAKIANEQLSSKTLDVLMGAGDPAYDESGKLDPVAKASKYDYVGGQQTWKQLLAGTYPGGWTLIQDREQFQKLAEGAAPRRLLGVGKSASTMQCNRKDKAPRRQDVPTLAEMSLAALNVLDDNPKGFYLIIEGGAVDWANHANKGDRMVEEMTDYLEAVEAVCARLDKGVGGCTWENTLVILTADHETGLIWGPDSKTVAFQPIVDHGPGKLPGFRYNTTGHSNSLVPLFARGPGAATLKAKAQATDPVRGPYVDNTDIFRLMKSAIEEDIKTP
jgi:alkaline phosphatase